MKHNSSSGDHLGKRQERVPHGRTAGELQRSAWGAVGAGFVGAGVVGAVGAGVVGAGVVGAGVVGAGVVGAGSSGSAQAVIMAIIPKMAIRK